MIKSSFKKGVRVLGLTHHCFPCLAKLAHFTIELVTGDPQERFELTQQVTRLMSEQLVHGKVPAHLGTKIQRLITSRTKEDVYQAIKQADNSTAEELVADLVPEKLSLTELVQLSIIGNVIDSALFRSATELEKLQEILNEDFGVSLNTDRLERIIAQAETILYLTDNCGEIVFDRLLLKRLHTLGKQVTLSPRSQPICNDATTEDVVKHGLSEYVQCLLPGSASMGLNLEECSPEFLECWNKTDLIIAKGMGNFEALRDRPEPIIYLFKAKCLPVAASAEVDLNDNLMLFSTGCLL